MKDAILRRQKDRFFRPLVERYLSTTSPNLLSIIAVVPGLLSAIAIFEGYLAIGLTLWLFNRFLDGIDGLAARVHNKKSDLGGYLDLILDFVAYLVVPIAFAAARPEPILLWSLIFLLASYQMNTLSWTLLSALQEKRSRGSGDRLTSIELPAGLIEGAETTIFYSLFFLASTVVEWLFFLMGALVFLTAAQRVRWAIRNL